jgi:hypothetical protein
MRRRLILLKRFLMILILFSAIGLVVMSAGSVKENPVTEAELDEASGLAASHRTPGILYTHNDSGGKSIVYTLNPKGMMPAKLLLEGIKNRDWEDIATGTDPKDKKSYVFVGEIGDNNAKHKSVLIHRFPEPALTDTLIRIDSVQTIEVVYEDGPRDAEGLFSDSRTGDLYIVSKREAEVGVYRVAYPQSFTSVNTAVKVCTLPYSWVTAADISPNGKYILIKTYTTIYRYKRGRRMSIAQALARKPKLLPYKLEPQGEAVCYDARGKGYYTLSEKNGDNPVYLYYYK